jgi:hypothetical protein
MFCPHSPAVCQWWHERCRIELSLKNLVLFKCIHFYVHVYIHETTTTKRNSSTIKMTMQPPRRTRTTTP